VIVMDANVALAPRPWGALPRLVLGVGWALGLATVAAGWWGTSGEPTVGRQFRWVGAGATGVMLAGAVSALWLLAGRRSVGLRSRRSIPVPDDALPVKVVDLRSVPETNGSSGSGSLVAASGMRYFHRASCALVRGKAAGAADRADHIREGRVPCGVCQPCPGEGVSP